MLSEFFVLQNTEFVEGARKLRSYFDPFVDQSLWNFARLSTSRFV